MAAAFAARCKPARWSGCVIAPAGLALPRANARMKRLLILRGEHPLPGPLTARATKRLLAFARSRDPESRVIFFLSGGASSLFDLPLPGVSAAAVRQATELLMRSGATISEVNCVRKHLSEVKGGRFASILDETGEKNSLSFILSDVEGDSLDAIGSGPTVPDASTYADALRVLKRLALEKKFPGEALCVLRAGAAGRLPETPKPGDLAGHRWKIIGNARSALQGAKSRAERVAGLSVVVEKSFLTGEARALGKRLAETGIRFRKPTLYIASGEPVVTVKGKGTGGRCQETALSFLIHAPEEKEMWVLAAGTDGMDGPTNAAGAIATGRRRREAARRGISPEKFLEENDSYNFFRRIGGLLPAGYTGTNVNDLFLLLVP